MKPAGLGTFKRLLAGWGQEKLSAFVSDLWSARGFETTDGKGNKLVVRDDSGDHRILLLCTRPASIATRRFVPGRGRLNRVDAVVTNRESVLLATVAERTEAEYIGPERLFQFGTYAIDELQRNELYSEYFGDSMSTETGSNAETESDRLARVAWIRWTVPWSLTFPPRRYVSVRNAAVFLCCCLLVVGIASSQPVQGPDADSQNHERGSDVAPLIAGLEEGNVSALLARHERTLEGRSARLSITHVGTRGLIVSQRRWEWGRQRLSTRGNGQWQLDISGALSPATVGGEPNGISLVLVGDGADCVTRNGQPVEVRLSADPCSRLSDGDSSFAVGTLSNAYLSRYLTDDRLMVRPNGGGQDGRFEVVSSVPPAGIAPEVRDYTARAIISETGFVRELHVTYRLPTDRNGELRAFSFTVENVSTHGQAGATDRDGR